MNRSRLGSIEEGLRHVNKNIQSLFPDPHRVREENGRLKTPKSLGLPNSAHPKRGDPLDQRGISEGIAKLYTAGHGVEYCASWAGRSRAFVLDILFARHIPIHAPGRSANAQFERARDLADRVKNTNATIVAREEGMTPNALACLIYRWGLGQYGPKDAGDKQLARRMWKDFKFTDGLTVDELAKKHKISKYVTLAWLRWFRLQETAEPSESPEQHWPHSPEPSKLSAHPPSLPAPSPQPPNEEEPATGGHRQEPVQASR